MLRRSLLFLSEQEGLKRALLRTRAARRMADRFVAGEGLDEALAAVRRLNQDGFRATLDYLGESVSRASEAERAADAYVESLARIAESEAESTISLKLTQLGLDIDPDLCASHLERIVAAAQDAESFVRIDMEGSAYTQATLDQFGRIFPRYRNVGVVIQSYLLRSARDVEELVEARAPVRLCKGAYKEPPEIAYQRRADIDAAYIHLARRLLDGARDGIPIAGVPPVALATHDHRLIDAGRSYADAHAVPSDAFEFQMLYGVRRDVQTQLVASGYHVRVYVPYGTEWYAYFMRRMAERPANLWFVVRAAAGR
ncbi:MAG: proline dehydrogenase family protein [Gemmatimonadota bacterium]|nr:proline dehydrogenase family protein [Gemmatimonadota bacterium]